MSSVRTPTHRTPSTRKVGPRSHVGTVTVAISQSIFLHQYSTRIELLDSCCISHDVVTTVRFIPHTSATLVVHRFGPIRRPQEQTSTSSLSGLVSLIRYHELLSRGGRSAVNVIPKWMPTFCVKLCTHRTENRFPFHYQDLSGQIHFLMCMI